LNLAKFNKAQQELDDVNERVEQAEQMMRQRPGIGRRAPSNMNF
jgi:tetrahydromethanopterin S-methyltransferase subunit G